jgi:hypothetical protein
VIRYFFDLLYGSTPVEIKSAFGLDESVARLQAASRGAFKSIFAVEQAAVGKVSASHVRLQRAVPMVGNSFKPFFFGRFEVRGEGVYLTGRFTLNGFTKVFVTLWLGGVLVMGTGGRVHDAGSWACRSARTARPTRHVWFWHCAPGARQSVLPK